MCYGPHFFNKLHFLILSSRSVSGVFSLVDFNPCLLMCRCPIILLLDFSRCLLMSFSVRPGHIFRKPCLIVLRVISVVDLKSTACKYWASYSFKVFSIIFFTTFSDFCDPRGTSNIPVFLFLVTLMISSPFFWIDISCFSSVMVHPSSYINHNDINGAV